jgi:16S rRNA (cytidine1402-2'-O)-methyltransferase
MKGSVYLIPIVIAEDGYDAIPNYITEKINQCEVFFAENIRTARRAFKKIDPKFDIDSRTWIEIGNNEEDFIKSPLTEKSAISITLQKASKKK